MKDLIIQLFGAYVPVMNTQFITVPSADGSSTLESVDMVVSGLAGVDWPWIAGVALFAIVLYCFFRLVGCLLK